MREIVDDVIAELEAGEPFALVTLVGEHGSTPRSAGARMLVRRDGSTAGTIGGGLLEATMVREAREVVAEGVSRVSTLRMAGRSVAEPEMLCGGSAEVLIAYVSPGDAALGAICTAVATAVAEGRPTWLFTVFSGAGSEAAVTYCLLDEGGRTVGQAPCPADELRGLLRSIGVHGTATLGDGRRVHAEAVGRPCTVLVCGAGHVGAALAPVAAAVGFRVTVVDDRPEFATRERFPAAGRVAVLESFDDVFAAEPADEHTYVVIVTRGHQHDAGVLSRALRTPAAYIGLMASRTKWAKIAAGLRELGFGDDDLARVRTPIGLEIGAESPAELAISIVAELIQERARRHC